MKLNFNGISFPRGKILPRQLFLVMKITVILLLAACLQVSARTDAQTITYSKKYASLEEVFKAIRKQTGYEFLYNDPMVSTVSKLDLKFDHAPIDKVLDEVFRNQVLTYTIIGKTIVVKKRTQQPDAEEQLALITVRGTVVDSATGEPLSGVTIQIRGGTIGAATDADGQFSISVPDNAVLLVSFLGYGRKEIPVNGRTNIRISLAATATDLDQLIVVGYGVQKKVDLTGAITQLEGADIANRPVSNIEQALQGMIPGLSIQPVASSGQPGEGYSVNIRGLASLANSSGAASFTLGAPYILVDGIPTDDLNDVDPNNVKSISVLKDAASTAIYGARAAYGVILITTKDGADNKGKMNVSYSYNYAMAQPVKYPKLVDGLTFALILDSAAANNGIALPYSDEAIERIKQYMADPVNTPGAVSNSAGDGWDFSGSGLGANANTDWYATLFKKNAIRQTHNINISGSNKTINYAVSLGLFDEDGISKYGNEWYQRKTFSGRLGAKPTDWLKIDFIAKYIGSNDQYPWDVSADARDFFMNRVSRLSPTLPLKDPAGGYFIASGIPQAQNERQNRDTYKWMLAPSVSIEPIKDWVTTLQYNYTYTGYTQTSTANTYYQMQPDSSKLYSITQSQTRYNASTSTTVYASPNIFSTYHRQIGDHFISGLVGFQQELQNAFGLSGNATYLLTDNIPSISTAVGTITANDDKSHWSTMSYFGRINYNYKEKYLFEANVRRDGSSRFEPGSRWGTFPSVSVGYNIAKEDFFPFKDQFSMLKIRASYGSIGNQNVANYLYVPLMTSGLGTYMLGAAKPYIVNPPNETSTDLTWEKVNTADVGLDVYLLDNRLSIAADWYQSDINNLVGPGIVVPEIYGTAVPKNNDGSLRTRGWELQINWRQKIGKDFSYFANFNLSNNRSVVTSYNNPLKLLSTFYKGQVIGEVWGYKTDGLYQSADDVTKRGLDLKYICNCSWNPGDVIYSDLDSNHIIDNGDKTATKPGDQRIIGNNRPQYQYGLYAGANWKGFDLAFTIQGVAKWDWWPGGGVQNAFWGPTEGLQNVVVLKGQEDYWRTDNTDAYFPRPYLGPQSAVTVKNKQNSDRYMQNRAYMRLKSLQVGYSLPVSLIRKVKASQLRIYFSGDNLFTRTKYMFFDPEVSSYANYPLQKVISFGCNVTF